MTGQRFQKATAQRPDAHHVVTKAKVSPDKKLAPWTKEKHLERLRVFFKSCVDRRLIAFSPCDGLRVTNNARDEEQTRVPFDEKDLGE